MIEEAIKEILCKPHMLGLLLGKNKLEQQHSDWIRWVWNPKGSEDRALMGHRGSYKTTAIAVIGTIWWLMRHPNERIAIIRKTWGDAAKVVNTIGLLMEDPAVQDIFDWIHGGKGVCRKVRDRDGEITFKFKQTVTPEASITAHGMDLGITGKHYDKILCDDIITLDDRISKAKREKTKEILRELRTNIIDPGCNMGVIGTPWHRDDAWSILECPIKKYAVCDTGLLSEEEIAQKKKTTTPMLYAINYDLDDSVKTESIFGDPLEGNWNFHKPNVWGHIDCAYGGDDSTGMSFMAEVGTDQLQGVGWKFDGHVDTHLDTIVDLYKRYRLSGMYCETNADQGYFAEKLRKRGLNVITYHESMNKHIKIITLLFDWWTRITWSVDTDPEYMEQIVDYREWAGHDDCPDSAASLLHQHFDKTGKTDMRAWKL